MKNLATFLLDVARGTVLAQRALPGRHLPLPLHRAGIYGAFAFFGLLIAVPLALLFVAGLPFIVLLSLFRKRSAV